MPADLPNETDFGNLRALTVNAEALLVGGSPVLDQSTGDVVARSAANQALVNQVGIYSLESLGVFGTDLDESAAMQAAFDAVPSGSTIRAKPGAKYRIINVECRYKSITFDATGATFTAVPGIYDKDLIRFLGSHSVLQSCTLGVDANGLLTATLPDGLPAGSTRNDWYKIVSDDLAPQVGHTFNVRMGQPVRAKEINGNVITFQDTLVDAALYQTNIRIARFTPLKVQLIGGTFLGDLNQPNSGTIANRLVWFENLVQPEAIGVTVGNTPAPGGNFQGCVLPVADRCHSGGQDDILGGGWGDLNCLGFRLIHPESARGRHLADCNANQVAANSSDLKSYGPSYFGSIEGGVIVGASTSGLTVHSPAYGSSYNGSAVFGGARGIGVRGRNITWKASRIDNVEAGIQLVTDVKDIRINGAGRFRNIRDQALVQSGQFFGYNLIEDQEFEFALGTNNAAFVFDIAAGGVVDFRNCKLKYNGTGNTKRFIQVYGAGELRLNGVVFDFSAAGATTSHRLIEIKSAAARISGVGNQIALGGYAQPIGVMAFFDAVGTAVPVDLGFEPTPAVFAAVLSGQASTNCYLGNRVGGADTARSSAWRQQLGLVDQSTAYHRSRDDVLYMEISFATAGAVVFMQPGHHRGQRIRVKNNLAVAGTLGSVAIAASATVDIIFNETAWVLA